MKRLLLLLSSVALLAVSCTKPAESTGPRLIFKFRFDSTQTRLDNLGRPAAIASGNVGQSPVFHSMSAHYIELAPDSLSTFGTTSNILYKNDEVITGGANAIDFSKSIVKGEGEVSKVTMMKRIVLQAVGVAQTLKLKNSQFQKSALGSAIRLSGWSAKTPKT